MSISPETIESIKQAAQIEEVVGDFVSLKKKGHYYMGCCPFHNEKTPSFTVTPAKGIYKCFGCGKSGDSIQFVMDLEGLTYPETIKFLASKYGVEINEFQKPEDLALQSDRESLYIILTFTAKYFENTLWEHEEGGIGLSYYKERGFSNNTIRKFGLGYSTEEWEALTKKALAEGYNQELLIKAGVSIAGDESKGRKLYDRFRGRVIFPIQNLTGKVIGFGARILKTDKKQPKYLNSPESEVYHKSKVLYGLFQAKQAIRQEDNCLLVEGYTDVISLHQEAIENVVASSGTSLTEEQIKLVRRYTQNITVLYDGDAAGLKASLRGIDMILAEDMNVKVVMFPDGEDPDSYIRKVGGESFKEYIKKHSVDFITFKTDFALKEAGNDPLKKAEVIRDIVDSISKIPDSIKRAVFFRQCSQMLQIDEQVIISEYNKIQLKSHHKKEDHPPLFIPDNEFREAIGDELAKKDFAGSAAEAQEREIIRLMLKFGNDLVDTETFAAYVLSEIEDTEFSNPLYKRILDLIKKDFHELGLIREQVFITHTDVEIRNEAIGLLTNRHVVSDNWGKYDILVPKDSDLLPQMGFNGILRLKFASLRFMIKENMNELLKAEQAKEDTTDFLRIHQQLKEAQREIAKILGIVISR